MSLSQQRSGTDETTLLAPYAQTRSLLSQQSPDDDGTQMTCAQKHKGDSLVLTVTRHQQADLLKKY